MAEPSSAEDRGPGTGGAAGAGPGRAGDDPAPSRCEGPDGNEIVYDDRGEGPPVVLLHGFAASSLVNWRRPGVAAALAGSGYRVLTPDLRGHGRSGSPGDPAAYGAGAFAADLIAVLDHARLGAAVLGGYSLGARVALLAAAAEPRAAALVLAGVGESLLGGSDARGTDRIADAMEARRVGDIEDRSGRAFRAFADATHADLIALARIQRALPAWPAPDPAAVGVPALVIAGSEDSLAGDPGPLAKAIPGAVAATVPGNHMNAMLDPAFARRIAAFLDGLERW
ncbi:MAG: alpha/beta fold hydrolase [Acidimicrobiales bacterium]